MTYTMKTQTDCGPAALSHATQTPYEKICEIWGWKDKGGMQDNLMDSPWHHFAVLHALHIPFQIVTCKQILTGGVEPERTMILLHNLQSPILKQHWVVLESVTPDTVRVHWGNGEVKQFTKANFSRAYSAGTPACAYEVAKGRYYKLSWYQRLWVQLTGRFI